MHMACQKKNFYWCSNMLVCINEFECAQFLRMLFRLNHLYLQLVFYITASGMEYLRKLSFIHRDIKPGNIMLYTTDDGR